MDAAFQAGGTSKMRSVCATAVGVVRVSCARFSVA